MEGAKQSELLRGFKPTVQNYRGTPPSCGQDPQKKGFEKQPKVAFVPS